MIIICISLISGVEELEYENNCEPSPCGPNSLCKDNNNAALCACLPGYTGKPPSCRPECISNSECLQQLACIRQTCVDPCPGSCGVNAECKVISHTPQCYCINGYTGDPFIQCQVVNVPLSPCTPSPCGPNALCKELNGAGSCVCASEYIGNPYEGCRPECTVNSDCSSNLACVKNRCRNPCKNLCGTNSFCNVIFHNPKCECYDGYTGDPYDSCYEKIGG